MSTPQTSGILSSCLSVPSKARPKISLDATEIPFQATEKHLVYLSNWQRDPSATDRDPMKASERPTVNGADAGFSHNQHSDVSYNDAYQYVKFDTSNYEIMKAGYAIQVQIEI